MSTDSFTREFRGEKESGNGEPLLRKAGGSPTMPAKVVIFVSVRSHFFSSPQKPAPRIEAQNFLKPWL